MTGGQRLTLFSAVATLLGALSLWGAFETARWVGPAVLAVLAVALACHLARLRSLPRLLVPLVGAVALLLTLTWLYTSAQNFFGVVPTWSSLGRLVDLLGEGSRDIARYAAPVSVSPGLSLMAAGGVGLVALVVDSVAVTWRRAALAGLPLLALYSVPAAVVPGGVGWMSFAAGAAGYLALLLAEGRERVGRWGRTLTGASAPRLESSPLAAVGRRVGTAAVALAVALPAVLPGLDDGVLGFGGSGSGGGGGSSTVAVDNPILDLQKDLTSRGDAPVLRYRTDAGTPGYLRLVTLDEFSGSEWSPRPLQVPRQQTVDRGLGEPPGLGLDVPRRRVRTEIEVERRFDSRWLPLPYAASLVRVDEGRWLYDRATWNVYSADTTTRERRYTVDSVTLEPTREQLKTNEPTPADLNGYLAVPADLPAEIRTAAERQTASATSDYEVALALQTWLRSPVFSYVTTAPSGSGASAISDFLESKQGFCVHFASAMAIMARLQGIPARVSVGYLPGRQEAGKPGTWVVTDRDAHAWPELYFPRVGWVAFEPTPAARTRDTLPSYATAPVQPNGETPIAPEVPGEEPGTATARPNPQLDRLERLDRDTTGLNDPVPLTSESTGSSGPPWSLLAVIALLLTVAVTPAVARVVVRRRRWHGVTGPRDLAEVAWAELSDTARDYGLPGTAGLTPRQYTEQIVGTGVVTGDAKVSLERLAVTTERTRYARPATRSESQVVDLDAPSPAEEASAAATARVRGDLDQITAAFASQAGRRRRLAARLLPASTVSLLHAGGERIADALDWLDATGASVRRRLLPRRRTT